jgi:3-methyladenine DNA glycosylase AlkD
MPATASSVVTELKRAGSPAKAKVYAWFFKTKEGQYGHGDIFLGVTVPEQRAIAKKFRDLSFEELHDLLHRDIHEARLTALLILVDQYKRASAKRKEQITRFYLRHAKRVNNWDLVDSSAPYILGDHLLKRDRAVLYRLARSRNLWERRIAIIATQAFIREGQFTDTLRISEILLTDSHDLIHKAVGWMLREVGNRSQLAEERFLKEHAAKMPRTALRYAIEKFPPAKRKSYMTVRKRV